jgi:hypothetical protein
MSYQTVILGILLGPTLAAAADDKPAEPRNGVYRVEIYQGPYRSVHYVGKTASPSEEAGLREQSRYENEAALADEVAALKRQYVRGEQVLDAGRRPVQAAYYGMSVDTSAVSYLNYGAGAGFGYSYAGFYPFGGYGYNGVVGGSTSVSRGLEHGVGDEGPLKRGLAQVIAAESASGGSSRVFAPAGRRGEAPVGLGEPEREATLTLKDGKEVKGLVLPASNAEWFVLRDGKADVWVRSSEVVRARLEEAKGVKPAVDK